MAALSNAEKERLNSSRVHLRRLLTAFAASLPEGSRVLDAGAGNAPYRGLFKAHRYETADKHPASTFKCDLHAIPLPDASFDAIVSTQTLEHTQDPAQVLRELHRVMKPGAPILLSAPFAYEEHLKPNDFYRFTSFGLRHLFELAGFEIESIDWLEGWFGTLGYLLRMASDEIARLDKQPYSAIDQRILARSELELASMGQAFNELDLRRLETSVGFPINWVVRARKPPAGTKPAVQPSSS
jgi:SAM-dependent methyltransferase